MDQINVDAWIGRTEIRQGRISDTLAAQINATLPTRHDHAPGLGEPLPSLWHWCAFPPLAPTATLGRDGHPPLGEFLPPLKLERRMWAGGDLTFHRPVHVDEALERMSRIRSVVPKEGAAGPMVFVTVDHEISGEAGLAISERQDIVYLPIPDRYAPPKKIPAPAVAAFDETVAISTTLLFRYSAVTFNGHRIHYDLDYAREVEHYPGLVVHGPLQATLLADAATRHRGAPPRRFRFRGVHPAFHTDDLRLLGVEGDGGALALCTAAPDGHQAMQATADWEENQ